VSEPEQCPHLAGGDARWDGELDDADAVDLRSHLAGCPHCQAERKEWQGVSRLLAEGDPALPMSEPRRLLMRASLLETCARSQRWGRFGALRGPRPGGVGRAWGRAAWAGLALSAAALAALLLARTLSPPMHPSRVVRQGPDAGLPPPDVSAIPGPGTTSPPQVKEPRPAPGRGKQPSGPANARPTMRRLPLLPPRLAARPAWVAHPGTPVHAHGAETRRLSRPSRASPPERLVIEGGGPVKSAPRTSISIVVAGTGDPRSPRGSFAVIRTETQEVDR
jgi:hypothetical protein